MNSVKLYNSLTLKTRVVIIVMQFNSQLLSYILFVGILEDPPSNDVKQIMKADNLSSSYLSDTICAF